MITLDDIIGLCPLTPEEVAAIAEHEHADSVTAAALAEYTMHLPKGPQAVQGMICDDIRNALHGGDIAHASALCAALRHFMTEHPEAARGAMP